MEIERENFYHLSSLARMGYQYEVEVLNEQFRNKRATMKFMLNEQRTGGVGQREPKGLTIRKEKEEFQFLMRKKELEYEFELREAKLAFQFEVDSMSLELDFEYSKKGAFEWEIKDIAVGYQWKKRELRAQYTKDAEELKDEELYKTQETKEKHQQSAEELDNKCPSNKV